MLVKETEENTNKWEGAPCSWTRGTNYSMPVLSNVIHRYNAITLKLFSLYYLQILIKTQI